MNDTAVDDDYVVKLPSGDARVMSLDELDAAFEAGTIHKDSPVLAPGNVTWTTLGVLAGLDEIATPVSSPVSLSPSSMAPMAVDTALDDDDGASFVPRRRAGKVIGVLFGAVALLAVGFAIKGAITQTLATRAGEAALAAQPAAPAPPPPAPAPPPAPIPSPVVAAVAPAPPPPAPSAAPAPATSKAAAAAADKDKKKGKLPGAPSPTKKKK